MERIKNHRTVAQLMLVVAMAGNLLRRPMASKAATYSFTDLNPRGFTESHCNGTSGNQQLGYGRDSASGNNTHALLWSGTASSAVDLNPNGFKTSFCFGNSASQQVGFGSGSATGNEDHALLWSGTASSVVDINPSGFTRSRGFGISGSQQVGQGSGSATGSNDHALLWSGTANSVVDLNPSGFTTSEASHNSNNQQVGYGSGPATGNNAHALLWTGTASSVLDLHSFLSSAYSNSCARGIDANGNIVGYAAYIPTGRRHAVLWRLVPGPDEHTVHNPTIGQELIDLQKAKEAGAITDAEYQIQKAKLLGNK